MAVITITKENFEAEVLKSAQPYSSTNTTTPLLFVHTLAE